MLNIVKVNFILYSRLIHDNVRYSYLMKSKLYDMGHWNRDEYTFFWNDNYNMVKNIC